MIDSASTPLKILNVHEDGRDRLLAALAQVTPHGAAHEVSALVSGAPPGPLIYITGRLGEEDAGRLHPAGATAPMLLTTAPLPGAAATLRQSEVERRRAGRRYQRGLGERAPERIVAGDAAR